MINVQQFGLNLLTALLIGSLLLVSGCKEEELDVAYLYIPEVSVTAPPGYGGISERILAVRITLGPKSIGIYPVPARIPILGTGTREIIIEPVVNRSGISEEYLYYPNYKPLFVERTLVLNEVDTLRPVFSYLDGTIFGFIEDFEESTTGFQLDLDEDSETGFEIVTDPVDPSRRVGKLTLTAENPVAELGSLLLAAAPGARQLWLELDYRGEAVLTVTVLPNPAGTRADRGNRYNQGALPRDNWRKFYFDLANVVSQETVQGNFRVGLLAAFDPRGPDVQEIYLDNLKLIYR